MLTCVHHSGGVTCIILSNIIFFYCKLRKNITRWVTKESEENFAKNTNQNFHYRGIDWNFSDPNFLRSKFLKHISRDIIS